ncbi:polyamine ABC transporter substrate-binding protein [Pseudochelatococcus contaminans]|uniref:Putrescine-binding periplasmic protein n=1 Tax=Pseudochelatococcus contaminans TaxID=1538103 RepID=A0A7W5Z3W7_9HYPH|nr:polyamine ABC transporter substrate-binding protein [Pseudochelatococcus contaminans]MBB3809297.1 putrescine transport system substrate-binding protein [Pseudochelatococcus contaminans]
MIRAIASQVGACLASASVAVLLVAGPAAAQDRTVNVYNWSDYIAPGVLDDFTKETGIRVVYDTYDNNEIVETKLLTGKSGYDLVGPSGPFLQRLIKANVFQPIELEKIPNAKNLWPEIAERLQVFDPGNKFAANYMWGTTGVGVNVAKVRERLGQDAVLNTWDLVLDPEVAAKLKDCGIYLLDSPEDLFPGVLNYLGLNPDSKDQQDLQKAADALIKVRPFIRKFHSSEYINALANGDICVAVGYSGDILQSATRAQEAGNGVEISYQVPREGALMWFDSFAIPADAPNPEEARIFLDFLNRPEIAARNASFLSYASGNLAARPLVEAEVRDNPGIYPDDETMKRLFTNTAYDDRTQRAVTRLWTRIKTGR